MRGFKVRFGRAVATFGRGEVTVLVGLVGQIRTLLTERREAASATDPLAEITGLTTGADRPPDDPALARLLPDYSSDDVGLATEMRMLREPEVIAAKNDAATIMLRTLPDGGGTVRLDESTARSWLVTLNDVRLVLATRLNITDDEALPAAASAPPDSGEHAMYVTYGWLSAVQESLVDALME